MAPKLYYFTSNGVAEPIRYILHYTGQEFEDIRYADEDWPDKELVKKLPYGQLPFYEDGDRTLNQSLAIARYVASKTDLMPSDPWDQAVLDAFALDLCDFVNKTSSWMEEQDPVIKTAGKKELEITFDFYFSRFEKHLKNNNGHLGGKLSWADFVLVGVTEALSLYTGVEIEKKYPSIQALVDKIIELPRVKDYIAKRGTYNL